MQSQAQFTVAQGYLGVAVLGVAVLGTTVLGTAVLQPGPRIQPSPGLRPSLSKEHHTACSRKPDSQWPNQMGWIPW